PPVGLRADGVDDAVVEAGEVVGRQVAAELDVAEETKTRLYGDLHERARHVLDLRVVGRDAEPDQAPRRRQPLDHVDLDTRILRPEERACGVEPGGPGSDDGDAKRPIEGHASILRGGRGAAGRTPRRWLAPWPLCLAGAIFLV